MFPVPYNSNQTGNNDFHGSNDRNFTAFRDVLQTFIIEDIADCRCNQRIEESPERIPVLNVNSVRETPMEMPRKTAAKK